MRRFELVEPGTLEEACGLLSDNNEARAIAGGTALLTLIKHGVFLPKTLVNLKKIKGATEIDYDSQKGLRIGALATIYDVESSPLVQRHYPVLGAACHVVANIRIRNVATIGGNLAHGDYQSDPSTVLVALDAGLELMRRNSTRQIKIADFLRGSYETALEPGELVAAILIPPAADLKGAYIKFTTGSSEERPCAGIAVLAKMENSTCRSLAIVVGAVSPRPVRIDKAEEMASGQRLDVKLMEQIATEASRTVDPIDDLRGSADYKRHLVQVLVPRALSTVAQT
jgi:aerobic carbon-monoxide dehydrogenase medium subunit